METNVIEQVFGKDVFNDDRNMQNRQRMSTNRGKKL